VVRNEIIVKTEMNFMMETIRSTVPVLGSLCLCVFVSQIKDFLESLIYAEEGCGLALYSIS
jgi:hypothetical protein